MASSNSCTVCSFDNICYCIVVFETNLGVFEGELYAKECPETVWNFINLAEGRQQTERGGNFYDGLTFHRVIQGFMIQGGCPLGTGTGGPGYRFKDEFNPSLRHDSEGILSMANAGSDTNGCQFFITYTPQHGLDGKHSVFGQVMEGVDTLERLTPRDPARNPDFTGDKIIRITIKER